MRYTTLTLCALLLVISGCSKNSNTPSGDTGTLAPPYAGVIETTENPQLTLTSTNGAVVQDQFELKNAGALPMQITSIRATCDCLSVTPIIDGNTLVTLTTDTMLGEPIYLLPEQSLNLKIEYDPADGDAQPLNTSQRESITIISTADGFMLPDGSQIPLSEVTPMSITLLLRSL